MRIYLQILCNQTCPYILLNEMTIWLESWLTQSHALLIAFISHNFNKNGRSYIEINSHWKLEISQSNLTSLDSFRGGSHGGFLPVCVRDTHGIRIQSIQLFEQLCAVHSMGRSGVFFERSGLMGWGCKGHSTASIHAWGWWRTGPPCSVLQLPV